MRMVINDPLADAYVGMTPYGFVGNDPINYLDPNGRKIDEADSSYWLKEYDFMKAILIIITALSAVSCGPGFGDISRELSGGYSYRADGGSTYLLGPGWGKQIYPKVIDYDFDSTFIIVVQKPSLRHHKAFLHGKLSMEYGVFIDYEDENTLKIDVDFLQRYLF
ncbi:hypothetical protein, partial [Sphingobacterium alkalisoli]|uniref:hypothetical protein n=1 Tax=Sphingobacterium alkalisoli TaxID=1874115 RepID=UPI001E2DBC04